jgi:hypothetical protein
MAEPDPSNVAPWYLRNINQALALDEASGNVYLRTGFTGNIIIEGNVEIPGTVTVNSSAEDPVHVHLDEIGTSGILDVPYMPIGGNVIVTSGNINANVTGSNVGLTGNLAGITGNVNIGTMPAITGNVNANITGGNVNAAVTGTVAVSSITGNLAGITGNVNIGTMPNVNANITGGNVTVTQGTSPWVVSGNVNANVSGNVNANITGGNVNAAVTGTVAVSSITGNIAGITANVTVVDGGGSLTVDGNVGITGTANVALGGTQLDAFGRLRVSNPVTLFDSQNRYLSGQQFSNVTATGGNVIYVANESSFNLNVSTANGSSAIQQAKFVQPYQPGKSMLVMESFCMSALQANCRQRVGYFTTNDGVYFEADGTSLYLVIRSSASGAIVEERIAQANWNTNSFSNSVGANPSGINLNPALTNIFWCDIEWLGVGSVRTGFIVNGQFIVAHTFHHANQSGNTKVYMTTASLNPRYEITNTGTTASNSTLKQICCTVISEGGYTPATTENYVSSGITPTRVATGNAYTALASIRLNPAYPDAVVLPSQLDLLLTDVQYGQYQLVLNASNVVANTSWTSVGNSVVQTNLSPLLVGDGTVLFGGVTSSRDTLVVTNDVKARLQLSRQADGTPDILTLCVGYGNPNADLLWRLGWEEITN